MNAPPPRPELCGSTRPSTACTATAASIAEPPAFSTFRPAATARGLAAATLAGGGGRGGASGPGGRRGRAAAGRRGRRRDAWAGDPGGTVQANIVTLHPRG